MNVHFSSKTDMWATPQDTFDALAAEFGPFDLDVCATPENAKCPHYYTREDDGLAQPWTGRCFMNPPYGRTIGQWMKKAYEESQRGALVVCLVPARTDTAWWHDYAMKGQIRFLRGRLKFGGSANSAPFPSAVVVFANSRLSARHVPARLVRRTSGIRGAAYGVDQAPGRPDGGRQGSDGEARDRVHGFGGRRRSVHDRRRDAGSEEDMSKKTPRALMSVPAIRKELEQGIEVQMYCGGGRLAEISFVKRHKTGIAGASFMLCEYPQPRMWATAMNVLKAVSEFELAIMGGKATIKLNKPRRKK